MWIVQYLCYTSLFRPERMLRLILRDSAFKAVGIEKSKLVGKPKELAHLSLATAAMTSCWVENTFLDDQIQTAPRMARSPNVTLPETLPAESAFGPERNNEYFLLTGESICDFFFLYRFASLVNSTVISKCLMKMVLGKKNWANE